MRIIEEECGRGNELTRGLKMGRNLMVRSMIDEPDSDDESDV